MMKYIIKFSKLKNPEVTVVTLEDDGYYTMYLKELPGVIAQSENKEDIESFDNKYLEDRVRELLEPIKEIKNIKVIKITGHGNELVLYANMTAGKFLIPIDISIDGISIVNQGNSIRFEKNYLSKITATKAEETVKDKISEHIDSIGIRIMEFISMDKNKPVEKIWIEDGKLKVLYKSGK